MGAFEKIFRNHALYNVSKAEIVELENSDDQTVQRETKEIFRPIFDDIQKERTEAQGYSGITIRLAEKHDFEDIIALSRRIT